MLRCITSFWLISLRGSLWSRIKLIQTRSWLKEHRSEVWRLNVRVGGATKAGSCLQTSAPDKVWSHAHILLIPEGWKAPTCGRGGGLPAAVDRRTRRGRPHLLQVYRGWPAVFTIVMLLFMTVLFFWTVYFLTKKWEKRNSRQDSSVHPPLLDHDYDLSVFPPDLTPIECNALLLKNISKLSKHIEKQTVPIVM